MVIYFRIINQSRWCLSHFLIFKCAFGARRMGQIEASSLGNHTHQFYLCNSTERPWLVETIIVVMIISYCPASLPCKTLVFTKVWIWVLLQECAACVNVIHLEHLQKTQVGNHCSSSCSLPNRSDSGSTQFGSWELLLCINAGYPSQTHTKVNGLLLRGKTCITNS